MMYFCGVWDAILGIKPRLSSEDYMRGYTAERNAINKNRLDL